MDTQKFDVVLLDLTLADIDGVQVVGLIKDALPRIPIIVFTGRRDAYSAPQTLILNLSDYGGKDTQDGKRLSDAILHAMHVSKRDLS